MEEKVDAFMDAAAQGMLAFELGIRAYMDADTEGFERHLQTVSDLEHQADGLSRDVETELYTYSLIPEYRGDVLAVLEGTDNLIDMAKAVLTKFETEIPRIPAELGKGYLEVAELSTKAADHLIRAARCYFRDTTRVKDDLAKVDFYESETDKAARRLKRAIFRTDLELAHKIHLRYFAEKMETISDLADDAAATLAIATIRRSV
ncbi:MAG: DUF47 family protein [Pseudomonadota bacterium]